MTIPISKQTPYTLKAIDNKDIERIHHASLKVLTETGVFYEETQAVDLLTAAGANAGSDGYIRLPAELVEWAISTAPKRVVLYSRLGAEAMRLEPGYVYFGTGSDCPHVLDSETGERRLATKADIELFTRLSDALPQIDFILSMGVASDVPITTADLHQFQAMIENTTKPVFFTLVDERNMTAILELASLVAGGMKALQERPFVVHFGMPSPPLRHSKNALHNLIACARHSIPVVYASGTQMGTSGPMSIAGSTVSSNCDVLSGLVVHQLAKPGAPFIYGVCVPPFDMRTTIESYGAPEHFLGDLVNVQVAQRYELPSWGYAADTDAKTLDLQAALEYFGSALMGLLSGCNLLHDVGYLESGLVASCESILFGNEVVEFARRILQPVRVDDETLAVDLIQRVGPGGTFLTESHTLRHFREIWYSPLIDRTRFDGWVKSGKLTMQERVQARVKDILARHQPVPLDPEVMATMRELISTYDRQIIG